jgi:hypothetical protein
MSCWQRGPSGGGIDWRLVVQVNEAVVPYRVLVFYVGFDKDENNYNMNLASAWHWAFGKERSSAYIYTAGYVDAKELARPGVWLLEP